jgi:hypothetical protein
MTAIPSKSYATTGERLIQQATRQATDLFKPPSPYIKQAVQDAFVPMQTDWVVEDALKQAGVLNKNKPIQALVDESHLVVTSPKRPYIKDVQWGQDFEDYKGNPLLAMTMLATHGNLGRAEAKSVDLTGLKKVAPALHKVLRDPDNAALLGQVIDKLPAVDRKGIVGKTLAAIQDILPQFRVGTTFESKKLKTIPITTVVVDNKHLDVPEHLQQVDLRTLTDNLPTVIEHNQQS